MYTIQTGRIDTNTSGEKRFIEVGCPYCAVDTGGNHERGCPNNYKRKSFEVTE